MPGIHDLWLFVVSGLLLNLTPGPDSLLIVSRSATQGWRAGLAAGWGVCSGVFVHVAAAALGLSALLATSATAFTVVKLLGAAYLVWMGVGMLRARGQAAAAAEAPRPAPLRQVFAQGFLTNVLNPKVALFFLAFVPQFIASTAPSKPLAFLVLGVIFDFNSLLWCTALALSTAFARSRMRMGAGVGRGLSRAMGAVFLGLGLKLALASR